MSHNDHSAYTVSLHYDRRLYKHDIVGSMAHVRMLAKQGILPQDDSDSIMDGLGVKLPRFGDADSRLAGF